jgi:hypothetical protein
MKLIYFFAVFLFSQTSEVLCSIRFRVAGIRRGIELAVRRTRDDVAWRISISSVKSAEKNLDGLSIRLANLERKNSTK